MLNHQTARVVAFGARMGFNPTLGEGFRSSSERGLEATAILGTVRDKHFLVLVRDVQPTSAIIEQVERRLELNVAPRFL